MKDIITHLFPPKELQIQNRYLQRGVYKTRDTNIRNFVRRIDKIVEYLNNFLLFGSNRGLPESEILDIVKL